MGADIYLNSIYKARQKKFRPSFNRAVKRRDTIGKEACVAAGLDPDTWGNTRNALDANPKAKAAFEKAQARVDRAFEAIRGCGPDFGYFRDLYNETGLYGRLGRSWWRDVDLAQEGEWFAEDGSIKRHFLNDAIDAQKAYRDLLRPYEDEALLRLFFDQWVSQRRVDGWTFEGEGQSTVDEWWEDTKNRLTKEWLPLLDKAIELNEPLSWSV